MRFVLPILAALGLMTGTAYAAASDADLEALAVAIAGEEVACDRARADADAATRANTRPLFRAELLPIVRATSLAEAQAAGRHALEALAAAGPAESAAKTIHTVNRQMGAECLQGLRRAQARVSALVD